MADTIGGRRQARMMAALVQRQRMAALPAWSTWWVWQDRMHGLRSYRIHEVLGPADPPLQSDYAFQAPDRMRLDIATGAQTIFIGPTRYTRADPSSPWQAEQIGVSLAVPSFTWDPLTPGERPVAVRIVGAADVDGVSTQALAFFQSS